MFPSAKFLHLLDPPKGGECTNSLGSVLQCLTSPSMKKFFIIFNLISPGTTWAHFLSSCHFLLGRREWFPPDSNILSVVEINKVPSEPPFLLRAACSYPGLPTVALLCQDCVLAMWKRTTLRKTTQNPSFYPKHGTSGVWAGKGPTVLLPFHPLFNYFPWALWLLLVEFEILGFLC